MSRFLLMTYCKASNLFFKELMFKCPTMTLLRGVFFQNPRPNISVIDLFMSRERLQNGFRMNIILIFLLQYTKDDAAYQLSFNKSVEISSELTIQSQAHYQLRLHPYSHKMAAFILDDMLHVFRDSCRNVYDNVEMILRSLM